MMHSHLHSLIAKAHRYQTEPERFQMISDSPLMVDVRGANGEHLVELREGQLRCNCDGFSQRSEGICAHVLGVEHHFKNQVPAGAVRWPFSAPAPVPA